MRYLGIVALVAMAAGCADEQSSATSNRAIPAAEGTLIAPAIVKVAAPQPSGAPAYVPDADNHSKLVVPFLKAHCLKCHGPDRAEAGFRVDRHLPNDFLTRSVAARWSDVLDKLHAGTMPPQEESRPAAEKVT